MLINLNNIFYKYQSHYFCLLTGTNLLQRGTDKAGILGFQIASFLFFNCFNILINPILCQNDIKQYAETIRGDLCSYCNKLSAPIKCADKRCSVRFHFICGTRNNCVSEFLGKFLSYCHAHHKLPTSKNPHTTQHPCGICFENMLDYNPTTSFQPACCNQKEEEGTEHEYWYHKRCIIRGTAEAGYYTNCIYCTNKDAYIPQIKKFGVYVPER